VKKDIFNKPLSRDKRRALRKNSTEAEKKFWEKVRGKRLLGLKFRRQHGIGNYIVDFYCPKLKVVVEIDGESHFTDYGQDYDRVRTEFLNELGIKVVRFSNDEVMRNIEGVFSRLKDIVYPHLNSSDK
jgi:very-short-patch-repair endonuclease